MSPIVATTLLALATASSSPNIEDAAAILYRQNESGGMEMVCSATAVDSAPDKGTIFLTAAHCVTEARTEARDGTQAVTEQPLFLSTDALARSGRHGWPTGKGA